MSVTVAKTAGFCFGVNRAVEVVFKCIEEGKKVCTLGEIIHNPQIVEKLSEKGALIIDSIDESLAGKTVVIRSHGVAESIYSQLNQYGISYVDATCPFVAKIHKIVSRYKDDAAILIAGDKKHPEVQGIVGHCKTECHTFKNEQELKNLFNDFENFSQKEIVIVAQTTFNTKEWQKCVNTAKKLYTNVTIFDTICSATINRQAEAEKLAKHSDLMIVVGGRHSSNTAKLAEICGRFCKTLLIESPKELNTIDFRGYTNIGVTAGASTPAGIIKEVQQIMSENQANQTELSFEEMFEQSFKTIYTGEKVTGIVTGIAPNEVTVDIGTKHTGYIPLAELSDDPNATTDSLVKKGDELLLKVLRVNDVEGTVLLSKKKIDAEAGFDKVCEAAESGEVLEGTVIDVVKGGVIVISNGARVFVPASQATMSKNDNLEDLLKKTVSLKILEVATKPRRRIVGSIRAVLVGQKKELENKFWDEVEVGKVFKGVVKSITSYGAFVDLGGVDGMVHISELSWSRIKHPSEVVKLGDVLEVYVRDVDKEAKKISLGYKKNEDNPWEKMKDFNVGDVVKCKIVSLTPFGAFAQILPGVDGLIHISQISNERINKPADVLAVGQEVEAKLTEIDLEKKRISLSIKALLEASEQTEEAAE